MGPRQEGDPHAAPVDSLDRQHLSHDSPHLFLMIMHPVAGDLAGLRFAPPVTVAMVWKNGREMPLTDGSEDAWAGALAAAGGDVYAAGYRSNGTCNVATVWKNGVALAPLSNGLSHAQVNALAWLDGHLCAAGFVDDPLGVEAATIWVDGKPLPALEDATPGAVRGLAASGSDLYAVGYGGLLADRPRVWKNGESLELPGDPGRSSEVHALALAGTDVYSAGNLALETGKAAVWRNGQAALVGTGQRTEIKAIFLRQED
jgi:hypothetical protein